MDSTQTEEALRKQEEFAKLKPVARTLDEPDMGNASMLLKNKSFLQENL